MAEQQYHIIQYNVLLCINRYFKKYIQKLSGCRRRERTGGPHHELWTATPWRRRVAAPKQTSVPRVATQDHTTTRYVLVMQGWTILNWGMNSLYIF